MNIILTAGGSIEAIDDVRAIHNMSTGKLGAVICEELMSDGNRDKIDKIYYLHSKTAVLPKHLDDRVILIKITDTNSLIQAVTAVFEKSTIGVVIHSMAVSDYSVDKTMTDNQCLNHLNGLDLEGLTDNKISSVHESLYVRLIKTPKVIKLFKKLSPSVFLFGFKLLSGVEDDDDLVTAAKKQIDDSGSNVVIANDLKSIRKGHHRALFISKRWRSEVIGKPNIARSIMEVIRAKVI